MKILLFNLGSVFERIVSWDTEGYKTLFEHDVILWGPIPDSQFSFNGKVIPILNLEGPSSIGEVFARLPEGWVPDVVTCDTSVLNYITDIYLCPVRTILFTRDAWADTIYNRNLVEFFDFVCHSVIDLAVYNNYKINILPLAGFPVSLPGPDLRETEFSKREIDVICIANFYEGFYHERYRILYNLAESNKDNLKIHYYSGLTRKEIHAYYRKSKIVIDWAHTLSNRSYEAALNGCLLFSHRDNNVMKTFWMPGKEYVPYVENDLYDQLVYYINHPDKAREIIARAAEKIRTLPVGFGQYILENVKQAIIADVDITERTERIRKLSPGELAYRTATPLMYNYRYNTEYPLYWKEIYFERIEKAIVAITDWKSGVQPLIEAVRVSFLLGKFEICSGYLEKLRGIVPDYGWIYYLQGRIYYNEKEYTRALDSLAKAIDCATGFPGLLQNYVLPFVDKDLSCDGRRIANYLWQSVYNHGNEYQVKALLHYSHDLSGDILIRKNLPNEAKAAYFKAISFIPSPESIIKAAPLFVQSMEFDKILEITENGTQDSPYNTIIVFYKVFSLLSLNKVSQAISVLKRHRKALSCFKGIRRMRIIQCLTILISVVSLINGKLGSKFILKIIGVL
ncbi:MAG: glycosyltransferase [Bacteroidales bacterium]|nr:glycosyltransferase [Bacteroidales bacterium]